MANPAIRWCCFLNDEDSSRVLRCRSLDGDEPGFIPVPERSAISPRLGAARDPAGERGGCKTNLACCELSADAWRMPRQAPFGGPLSVLRIHCGQDREACAVGSAGTGNRSMRRTSVALD